MSGSPFHRLLGRNSSLTKSVVSTLRYHSKGTLQNSKVQNLYGYEESNRCSVSLHGKDSSYYTLHEIALCWHIQTKVSPMLKVQERVSGVNVQPFCRFCRYYRRYVALLKVPLTLSWEILYGCGCTSAKGSIQPSCLILSSTDWATLVI